MKNSSQNETKDSLVIVMRNNQSKGDDNMNSDAARLFVDYVIKDNDAARLRDD